MTDAEKDLEKLVDSAEEELDQTLNAYLPFEESYIEATRSGAIAIEGTGTAAFPRSSEVAWTSAR